MEIYRYILFRKGQFIGKYTCEQWWDIRADQTFECYVYLIQSKVWYYSTWGSLVSLNDSDLPNEIKAFQLLMNFDDL